MADSSILTSPTVVLEWRTGYQHRGIEPVDPSGLDYLLDGDDPLARAARASVVIMPTQVVAA